MVLNSIVGMNVAPPDNGEWQVKLDQTGVLGGIITGLITAYLYKRFHDIQLPDWLQFFGGKRFVPIITSFVMFLVGILFLFIWPPIEAGIDAVGNWVIVSGLLLGTLALFATSYIPNLYVSITAMSLGYAFVMAILGPMWSTPAELGAKKAPVLSADGSILSASSEVFSPRC